MKNKTIKTILILTCFLFSCASHKKQVAKTQPEPEIPVHAELLIFAMATCPHSGQAFKTMSEVKKIMGDSLSVSISYVGTVDQDGTPDLKHGQDEINASIAQICASKSSKDYRWYDFISCQYADEGWRNNLQNWETCAQKAQLEKEKILECIQSGEGKELLILSLAASAKEGIKAAPFVFINGKSFPGPMLKETVLSNICHLTQSPETKPEVCNTIPEPKKFEAILLNDKRCTHMEECDIDQTIDYISLIMPTLSIEEIDYQDEEGQKLYKDIKEQNGPHTLPLLIIKDFVDHSCPVKDSLINYLITFEDAMILALGTGFDPTKEICDNDIDDTGNGLIDCQDDDCKNQLICREEIKERLDFFIMSHCPYGAMIVPPVSMLVKHMTQNESPITVRFQFIGDYSEKGFKAMHGQPEIDENKRMLCTQELYSEDHLFMDYMMCRAKSYRDPDWKQCIKEPMEAAKIEECSLGEQGKELLKTSFQLAKDLKFYGSPSIMLNNRYQESVRTAPEILRQYCIKNPSDACEIKINTVLFDQHSTHPEGQCQ